MQLKHELLCRSIVILFFDSSASDARDACNARDAPLYAACNVAQPTRIINLRDLTRS